MRVLRVLLALLLVASSLPLFAAQRTIRIFQKRQIVIAVPEGWKFQLSKDEETGVQTIELATRDLGVQVMASFFPDANNQLATQDALEKRMRELFAPMLEGAVEEEMKFTFAKTLDGVAGYTSFTDRKWVDAAPPENERRFATQGIRSWPGVFMPFTILTNDTDSDEYREAIKVLTTGLREAAK